MCMREFEQYQVSRDIQVESTLKLYQYSTSTEDIL